MSEFRLLLFIFIGCFSVCAAQINLDFDQLSMDDGLSSSRATAIIQDKLGFIWIGTWNGLNRYDGVTNKVYKPRYRDTTSLANKEILSLYEDSDGLIWIGTTAGLSALNPQTGQFKTYNLTGHITAIYEDRSHNLWIGTSGRGLKLLNRTTGQITTHLNGEYIRKIYEDTNNDFWLATYSGLVNFNRNNHQYKRYVHNRNSRSGYHSLYDIAESPDGDLWVSSKYSGLFRVTYDKINKSVYERHYIPLKNSPRKNQGLHQLVFDTYGNLWLGSEGNGVFMLSKLEQKKAADKATFQNFRNDVGKPFGLKGTDFISALFIDNLGTLWASSSVINKANILSHGIRRFDTQSLRKGKLVNNWVTTFAGNSRGELFVGSTDDILIYKIDKEQSPLVGSLPNHIFKKTLSRDVGAISAIKLDSLGNLCVGTNNSGCSLIKRKHLQQIKHLKEVQTTPLDHFDYSFINQIVISKFYANTTWVGTANKGLVKYQKGANAIKRYSENTGKNRLSHNSVRVIIEDTEGYLWVGTHNGLNFIDPVTDKIKNFYFSAVDTSSINDNIINDIYEDVDGNIWVGTNSGINKITKEQEGRDLSFNVKSYPNLKKISNEIILNILEDNHRNIWVGIYNGLIKFSLDKEQVVHDYYLKEYSRVKIGRLSKWKDANGRFYFGGGNGFLMFHPDSIGKYSPEPRIQLTDFLLNNKTVELGQAHGKNNLLSKTITYTDTLVLSYKNNVFSFVFSLLDFNAPDMHKYGYLLEGFDNEWNNIQGRNVATYTDIPYGTYKFKVKGCNSSGIWSANTRELTVIILPPWWRTPTAYISYIIFIVLFGYYIYKRQVARIHKKNAAVLNQVHIKKEQELNDLKLQFFTNITHELRTPLSLILAPLEELMADKKLSKSGSLKLGLIKKSADRLLRLINQLMEFRKIENARMELHLQHANVVEVVTDVFDSFKSMANNKSIAYKLKTHNANLHAYVDSEKLQRILFNLLSNAFKFTEPKGAIAVNLGIVEGAEHYFIDVFDSGIGIADDKKERVFERFYQINEKNIGGTGGVGLYLTKAYVELHRGEIIIKDAVPKGTCFRVELPFKLNDNITETETVTVNESISEEVLTQQVEDVAENENLNKAESEGNKPYVLIAEDDVDMSEYLESSLYDAYIVKAEFNGVNAFETAEKTNPDLIILDVMMPEMDGMALCKKLKNNINTSHIPVLFLTAKKSIANELEGLRLGAVDYVTKPFSMEALHLKIKNILAYQNFLKGQFRKDAIMAPETIELTSIDEHFLKDVVEVIDRNLDNSNFDMEVLAAELSLSTNKVYRKIKALTNQTGKEFIRNQRLKVASNLIAQNKRSISEICYLVGFSSPSYFARCFRKQYGCTPMEYLNKHGETN